MAKVKQGLLIKTPHIDNILSGEKTWEMRARKTTKRGLIALIQVGSCTIVGVAEIIDSLGPISGENMLVNQSKHLMTPERLNDPEGSKYRNAWVLKNAKRLTKPIPYKHSSQVTWVNLDEETTAAVVNAMS